uniref:NADH dehydrogenase subunit 1 n=1 Tax=Aleurodicus dispersus TaxID=267823 RepID=U5IJ54_9HEMI|nr:NADH dehydrogenase subunit 1 [Aleurodicus dispersus]ALD62464.1 NADH dehydrogenase subunit 1 [Aleurodicus dispersus]
MITIFKSSLVLSFFLVWYNLNDKLKKKYSIVNGKNLIQVKYINLSSRNRGSVHRVQMNKKHKIMNVKKKIIDLIFMLKNIVNVINLMIKMLEYSAKKMKAKENLLYSMMKPEINSDSPSEKSKGVRLVSAKMVMIQMSNMKIKSMWNDKFFCIKNMLLKFICSVKLMMIMMMIIKLISYEIIWAMERINPIMASLELEDHLIIMMMIMFMDIILMTIKMLNLLKLKFQMNGSIIHIINEQMMFNKGNKSSMMKLDLKFMFISLVNNLMASLNGCKIPKIMVLLGPLRFCMNLKILRSINVKNAILKKMDNNKMIMFNK